MQQGMVDEYSVRIVRDRKTKNLIGEYWNKKGGPPHREFGPARAEFDVEGNPLKETYYLNGAVHRNEEQGPAIRIWSAETHLIVYEEYRWHGARHRTGNKPAVIEYDSRTGKVISQEYYLYDEEQTPYVKDVDVSP